MVPAWNGVIPDPTLPTADVGVIASATLSDLLGVGIPPSNPAGEPIDVYNHYVNFGAEYVYHCHILSHEEMDMMRPVVLAYPPVAPGGLSFDTATMTLSWFDGSLSETAFVVEKSSDGGATWQVVGQIDRPLTVPNTSGVAVPYQNTAGEQLSFTDSSWVSGEQYRVVAQNTVGDTWNYADPGTNEIVSGGFPTVTATSVSATLTP
jgi:hypothetical protein